MGGDDDVLWSPHDDHTHAASYPASYPGSFLNFGAVADDFSKAVQQMGDIFAGIEDVVTEEDEVEDAMTSNPLWGSF